MSAKRSILLVTYLLVTTSGCTDPDDPGYLVPPTVDEDPSLPALDVNGTRLHVQRFGDPRDPVVIFVHGGPGNDAGIFTRLVDLADAGYHVVLWDQRGSGLSRRHDPADFSVSGLVADLDELITVVTAESSDPRATLIGHSWGGMYATLYTSRHPDRVADLVLLEPGPLDAEMAVRLDDITRAAGPGIFGTALNQVAWNDGVITPDSHARADYLAAYFALANVQPHFHYNRDDPPELWRSGAVAAAAIPRLGQDESGNWTYDFTVGLEAFTEEVLIIRGTLTEGLDEEHHDIAAGKFPSARIVTIDGVGHDLPWSAAAQVLELIETHLAQ